MAVDVRPWQAVPAELGVLLCDAIPSIADDVVAMLGATVPAYRTLEGPFGRDVMQAVADALHHFAEVIEHRPPTLGGGRALYAAVGERWWRSGHSLDDLQAGYHLGARVVWRRIAAVATDAGFGADTISVLADSLFAYLDEIAAASVDGFVAAQTAAAGERERRRQQLVAALIARPAPERATLERRAREAGWPLPRTVAVLAIPTDPTGLRARRLPPDTLLAKDPTLVDDLARLRLAPLQRLPARSRARLEETLLAYLRHRGNGPRMAADLHVHPQTVRYRLARLRELLGPALDDPEARFELEVVLRARSAARPH